MVNKLTLIFAFAVAIVVFAAGLITLTRKLEPKYPCTEGEVISKGREHAVLEFPTRLVKVPITKSQHDWVYLGDKATVKLNTTTLKENGHR